ncbi:hypothetical protein [Pedobacter sp. SYSU D00535]|uniref:hypothetical protein n=1 Tax=Pedobacter sp. SYSU D00535 TaxID=2810308 RepID=UPI001A972824|nr:hypothetical protein [Pedobacter sp. SYSU D00535]
MLNLYRQLISNNLNNTIFEELSEEWIERLSPGISGELVNGFFNAGILTVNMSDFNRDDFYDKEIKNKFEYYCERLYLELAPIIEKCLRRMFLGFNDNLSEYKVVLFMEGREEDHLEAVKYNIHIF